MNYSRNLVFFLFLFSFLSASLIYATDIRQKDIPLVIKKSGQYNLKENVTYRNSGSAITIKANNVDLNLGDFSIRLSNSNATGILVQDVSEFTIKSDVIENTGSDAQRGNGISIVNSNKGFVENVFTINHRYGLHIKGSSDIQIQNSTFLDAKDSDALIQESTGIAFEACVFDGGNNGLRLSGNNKDCSLTNSIFPRSTHSNLYVKQVSGMYIDNCAFTNNGGNSTKANIVQFGGPVSNQACIDVIMKNCTIINRPALGGNTAPEGIGIFRGSGFLIESCVIDIDNTDQDPEADLSGIHIGNPDLGTEGAIASNVIIRNCIVQGPATNGLYPDGGASGIVIEGCLVSGASKDGIFLAETSASTVSNNTVINNGTNGIFLGETSTSNAVIGNVVNSNGFNPIIASLQPIGNGIGIASDSSKNLIQGNVVFNNAINGIDDQGTNNKIFNNTAYANVNKNYNAATDIIVVSTPGSGSVTAANINA